MMWKFFKNAKGITLIEVVASLVILAILLLTFLNIFVFSNKAAVSNQDKLITTYLAKATLERIKVDPFSYFEHPNSTPEPPYFGRTKENPYTYSYNECKARNFSDCELLYHPLINGKTYEILIRIYQQPKDRHLQLINVIVEAKLKDENISSIVEGYVVYE